MGCSLCDFLWTHISSDKSNSLNWSNEQTIPTSLSDTKVSQTGGCGNHVAVRGGQAVPRLWLLQNLIPQMMSVCASFPTFITLWALLWCVIDFGCSPEWQSRGWEGMGVPLPRRELAAPRVRAVLTPALVPFWEWGLPAVLLLCLQDRVVPGVTLRVTETVISQCCWFLRCLLRDNPALRTAPGGMGTGGAAISEESPGSQWVSHRSGCPGLGNCTLTSSAWFRLVLNERGHSWPRDLYSPARGKWFCSVFHLQLLCY